VGSPGGHHLTCKEFDPNGFRSSGSRVHHIPVSAEFPLQFLFLTPGALPVTNHNDILQPLQRPPHTAYILSTLMLEEISVLWYKL